jgi:alpha-1,6-mannosyltransferase
VAEELIAAGVPDVRVVPHGVDLHRFDPSRRPPASLPGLRLVWVGRLSAEKRPEMAVSALETLVARGHAARLLIVGDGPAEGALRRRAQGLPVTFTGHLASRDAMSHVLAAADVALATCPCESFGLAALEALGCGTSVVASRSGALRELVDPTAGRVSDDRPEAFADAVEDLLSVPADLRARLARRRAERFSWEATVDGLLTAHEARTDRSQRGRVPA